MPDVVLAAVCLCEGGPPQSPPPESTPYWREVGMAVLPLLRGIEADLQALCVEKEGIFREVPFFNAILTLIDAIFTPLSMEAAEIREAEERQIEELGVEYAAMAGELRGLFHAKGLKRPCKPSGDVHGSDDGVG